MSLGRRTARQSELFIPANQIFSGSGHPFYSKLNQVLAECDFDRHVEALCEPFYKKGGRPSIPPGVYFRMIFIGYFEGISSQRGIAWRCADSLALRDFLGFSITEPTPVHVSMTMIRKRLDSEVFDEVFLYLLEVLRQKGLLKAKCLGIDATTLEANAAMRSIVRKDNGKNWKGYLRQMAREEGMEDPSDEDIQRMDRSRKDKKVSNKDWESPVDPDSRITRMKDGRTHLAYKAEHAVDLDTQAIVCARVVSADQGDTTSGPDTLTQAQVMSTRAGAQDSIEEVVADKGYHSNQVLAGCQEVGIRTYIPERKQKSRKWKGKPEHVKKAFHANRRRVRGKKGRRLNRLRSERVERTFAHVCETGGSRRTWLRGIEKVQKIHVIKCAAYNLGLLMRVLFKMSKPRSGNWTGWAGLVWPSQALQRSLHTLADLLEAVMLWWLGRVERFVIPSFGGFRIASFSRP